MNYLYLLDLIGTAVFAASGIMVAHRHRMDIFGMVVLALVTAVGGGSIRDMALGDTPIFWLLDPAYLIVILGTCLAALLVLHFSHNEAGNQLIKIVDAVGLAAFTAIGVNKGLSFEVNYIAAITMGVLTGVGGGMIRDVLAREVPLVLRAEVYATACVIGGAVHVVGVAMGLPTPVALWGGASVVLLIRLAAIYWNLSLPKLSDLFYPSATTDRKEEG